MNRGHPWALIGKIPSGTVDITPDQYNDDDSIYADIACKNPGDYHDLYLQTDVFLLADIFEKFKRFVSGCTS